MKNKMIKIFAISLLVIVLLSLFVFNVFALIHDSSYRFISVAESYYITIKGVHSFKVDDTVYDISNSNYYIYISGYRDSFCDLSVIWPGFDEDEDSPLYFTSIKNKDVYLKTSNNSYVTFYFSSNYWYDKVYLNGSLNNNFGSYCNVSTNVNIYHNNTCSLFGYNYSGTNYRYMNQVSYFNIVDNLPQSSQPLSKTYNVGSFINDNQEYNQIVVNGISSDSSSFESITDIDYRNTLTDASDTVYSNSSWNGNYNSILNYYANGNVPVVSNINNDLNNLLTFSTNVLPVSFNNTYDVGAFINNGNEYDHINVIGTTINNSTYSSITSIDYVNNVTNSRDTVYSNDSWNDDFTSVLTYYSSGTVPDVSSINSATSSIITFTTSLYSVNISRTYYFDFYNNDQYFTSVTVYGVTNDNVVLSSVTSVYYDNTLVYDGLFITPYSRMLYYYNNMTVPDVHDLNEFCNFIVYFTPTVITTVSPYIVDELLAGVNVLLLPITSFISLAENNFVIAIILVMGLFGMVAVTVFSFIKRKNE